MRMRLTLTVGEDPQKVDLQMVHTQITASLSLSDYNNHFGSPKTCINLPVSLLASRNAVSDLRNTNGHHFDVIPLVAATAINLRSDHVLGQRRYDSM
jgi:hypothetical protein